jgi:hypothetical protein
LTSASSASFSMKIPAIALFPLETPPTHNLFIG